MPLTLSPPTTVNDFDAKLSDIETAFPGSRTISVELVFDGHMATVRTNFTVEEVKKHFIGKRIKMCWYDYDPKAEVCKLLDVLV